VIAEIRRSPVAGLGMAVPWNASAQPLGVEHDGGRLYVHFDLLWWWLKLGILGAVAYPLLLASAALMALRTWRQHQIPELRYFGLASLCAVVGLVAIETTASFTGVDPRFSLLFGAQLGLLATLSRRTSALHRPEPPRATAPQKTERKEFQLAT
jgi:O-antigen ligase